MRSGNTFGAIAASTIILILLLAGYWYYSLSYQQPLPEEPTKGRYVEPSPPVPKVRTPTLEEVRPKPVERPVVRFDADDPEFQELMERRKEAYGLDEGVDMIVREDETVTIGDETVPMSEVIERIRIAKGEMTETDLESTRAALDRHQKIEKFFSKLKAVEKRFRELDGELASASDGGVSEGLLREKLREHDTLAPLVADYQRYRDLLKAIRDGNALLSGDSPNENVRRLIAELESEKAETAGRLRERLAGVMPEGTALPEDSASLMELLDRVEERYLDITGTLENPESVDNPEVLRKLTGERSALRPLISEIRKYEALLREIEENEALLDMADEEIAEAVRKKLRLLRAERDDLENRMMAELMPGEDVNIYGIHVVRPGDNIWNIHFEFLREYFKNKGVLLSPMADEPIREGVSSGVGKILKFSETMVYIYNLRDKELSFDLGLIHPMSKIVVFNMGRALEMLERIDYDNIKEVRFDGENLWIPAG